MSDACPGCGLLTPDGTPACRAMFDELTIRQFDAPVAYPLRRMIVDTYALQHPDEFCASAQSLVAHLTGLCAALEHPDHPNLLRVLLAWLDDRPVPDKPPIPRARGRVTIVDTYQADGAEAVRRAADRWARAVWEAYAPLHARARAWVAEALARPARPSRR